MKLFEQFDAPEFVIHAAHIALNMALPDDPNIVSIVEWKSKSPKGWGRKRGWVIKAPDLKSSDLRFREHLILLLELLLLVVSGSKCWLHLYCTSPTGLPSSNFLLWRANLWKCYAGKLTFIQILIHYLPFYCQMNVELLFANLLSFSCFLQNNIHCSGRGDIGSEIVSIEGYWNSTLVDISPNNFSLK